jgi:hypothetical protein
LFRITSTPQVLGFFFLCKIVNEGNAKMLAQLENVWLTGATHNSVAQAEGSASRYEGQSKSSSSS